MKRSEIKLIVFSLIISIFVFINYFTHTFKSYLSHAVIVSFFFIVSYFLFGFEKNKVFNKKKLIKYFSLFLISTMILIYSIGIFTGFYSSPYSRSFFGIIKNTGWLVVFYVIIELLRYNISKKGEKNKLTFIFVILFTTLIDISLNIFYYNLHSKYELLRFITVTLVPSISKNFVLTSFTKKYGYEVCIIYQIIVNIYMFIMPIIPDFDYFLISVTSFMQPIFIWALCKSLFDKEEKDDLRNRHIVAKIISAICIFFALIVILLFSNLFRFWIAVIGTGSMSPTIKVGDLIIVDKGIKNHTDKLKVGDILVFEIKDTVYTHRIIDIVDENNSFEITTKGDRKGQAVDSWVVKKENIIGVVKFKISYIGYPTVWLNRMIREK